MPTLRQLTCNVEWAGSRLPLQEYHTIYADGYVETLIAVPVTPTPFFVHLRSHGYIAPGLAMFMDGVYQCNRNRRNLEIPDEYTSRKKVEVDFVVRQKEELLWDGTFEGKQWRFEKVKIVPDSRVEVSERPPHDGEYVGTIEVVVLRCHPSDKQPIIANETSSDESSDGNEPSMPGRFDGVSDPQPVSKSKSKSGCRVQPFGLDGGRDDWGPPPPPLDEPKMGKIEMTSENTGTWNPVGQEPKSSNALEETKRWDKRSESRDHFNSDFQKRGSPAGSQRGRSRQSRSTTDQENTPPLNLRGGGPGSYSISSSEAMRYWNGGPPALKEWTQGDASSKGHGGPAAAFDPWTANLPTGDFTNEAKHKPQTQMGAWGIGNETKSKPGSKKGSKRDSVVSRKPDPVPVTWGESNDQDQGKKDDWGGNDNQDQGNNAEDWGAPEDTGNGGNNWRGAGNDNAQNNDEWNAGGDQSQEKIDDWNNNGSASGWDAPKKDGKKDDGAWDPPNGTFNRKNDDWGGSKIDDTKQKDEWGATTGNDFQQGNSWGGDTGQQTDTWGGDDTKQVTTGAKDPEKANKPTSNQQAASGGKGGSILSFGNSRAKGSKSAWKAGSQGKPASVGTKATSATLEKKPLSFNWLKPSLEKVSNASGPPVTVKTVSVPGGWGLPVASSKLEEPRPVAPQVLPIFSISTPPKPKPYWSKWRNPNTSVEAEKEEEHAPSPEEVEEPVYNVPADVARRNMMSHQVRPGRPAAYTHKRNKPKYMDTHESPYAVFLFKYRDKEIIEHMLKKTITEPEVDEKARLASLSKQELLDELMKTKSKLSVAESDSSGQATFVKTLDEKLSKFETSKEEVPAVGDWVNTTSPTDGQGIVNIGAWRNNDTQNGDGGGDSGNGNETSNTDGGGWGGNGNSNDNTNSNGGESWRGNGDSKASGNSDWTNNGGGEASNRAAENGNDGNDWHNTDRKNGKDKEDENGWGGNDNGGSGDWSNNNGDTKTGDAWSNNSSGETKAADDWGNDKGGDSWDNNRGGGDGGWGGNEDKKDKGNDNAGKTSWGTDAGGEGGEGGGGGGW